MKKLVSMFLVFGLFALLTGICYAQEYSSNVFSSWFTVNNTPVSWTFPTNSRTIQVFNGDASNDVCMTFSNNINATNMTCVMTDTTAASGVFVLPHMESATMLNLVRRKVTIKSLKAASTASPVTVMIFS